MPYAYNLAWPGVCNAWLDCVAVWAGTRHVLQSVLGRAKLALAEKSITELKTAVDGKVQANTDLTKANAGKITKLELKTAGDLAVLPEILKCAELGQVYSKKDKKCTGAASSKCAILTNLNPLVAADAKLLAVNKHLIASEKVTKGAIVVDTNTCTQKTHFGASESLLCCCLAQSGGLVWRCYLPPPPPAACSGAAWRGSCRAVCRIPRGG